MIQLPRESTEFVPITVAVDGTPVTTAVEVSLTTAGVRPTTWQPATTLDGKVGLMTGTLDPDLYTIWVRITDNPETPVLQAGQLAIL